MAVRTIKKVSVVRLLVILLGPNTIAIVKLIRGIKDDPFSSGNSAHAPEKKISASAFRKVQVKVSAPGRGKMQVRTRPGYAAAGEKDSPLPSKGPA